MRNFISIIKKNPNNISIIPFHEQTSELIDILLEECKNFPGINPSDLEDYIRPDLRKKVLEFKGYWGVEFPSNDLVWRDE